MRLLPPTSSPQRVVAISIHVPYAPETTEQTAQASPHACEIKSLIEIISANNLPMTWAAGSDQFADLHERLTTLGSGHEIAILGDSTWLGSFKTRGTIVRVLNEASAAAEAAGFTLSSLVLDGVCLDADFDLFAKHGINVVARDDSDVVGPKPAKTAEVRTLRFGVWEVPTAISMPRPASRLGIISSSITRVVDRAMSRSELCHIAIDAAAIANSPAESKNVERLLDRLARQQEQGKLQVQTLSAIAAQLGQSPERSSASSILKTPAA